MLLLRGVYGKVPAVHQWRSEAAHISIFMPVRFRDISDDFYFFRRIKAISSPRDFARVHVSPALRLSPPLSPRTSEPRRPRSYAAVLQPKASEIRERKCTHFSRVIRFASTHSYVVSYSTLQKLFPCYYICFCVLAGTA